MKRLPLLIAFVTVLSSGLVHGLWTERWQRSAALEQAAARVDQVPLEIAGWKGKSLVTDPEEFAQAGAVGYWMREYRHKNHAVTVLLMCGRSGRMSVHTPDICYQGLGYQMAGAAITLDVAFGKDKDLARFWTARFTKQPGAGSDLRLFWSWNASGGWEAPSSPRWHFRSMPFLYKLYLVQETTANQRLENEPALEFLKIFLPKLNKTLVGSTSVVRDQ